MKQTNLFLSVFVMATLAGCQNSSNNDSTKENKDSTAVIDHHTSQNSLDWAGIYQDTIPCADCPGILTTVKLYEDGTYSYVGEYINRNTVVLDTGRFMWHNNGTVVHLKGDEIDARYKVGENVLYQADSAGNIMESAASERLALHKVF